MVSHELTVYLPIFGLFSNQWIMVILSKGCKPDNFASHNSLKLNFTNIGDHHSNLLNVNLFLNLCETNLGDSVDSGNFYVRGYLSLIRKDSVTQIVLQFMWRKDFLLHRTHPWKTLSIHSSSSLCMVFDAISSNIDDFLSINPSANVFVFGDSNHKDCITYSDGTYRLVNFVIIFLSQMILLRWLTSLLGSQTVTLTVPLFWIFISIDASICFTMASPSLGNSDHVVVSVSINFLLNSKRDAPFHCVAYDYSHVD